MKEAGPYLLYFNRTLFSHGNITEANLQRDAGYLTDTSYDYMRPENLPFVSGARERYRDMTLADVERMAEHWPWGTAGEVAERLLAEAEHAGASTVLISLNRGHAGRHVRRAAAPFRQQGAAGAASAHGHAHGAGLTAVAPICDCEHHTHDPAGAGKATEHDYGATVASVSTIKSPWGGTFRICQACVDAGHMQGLQFR